ncbi:MAG: flagellar biosynthesis anti-sigma factor FlgM [Gammaproteobacteria bacterium]|nr:flagellar biosynthesis anti-sigma factor FlgM [Gammaproteobacteria bacterium]MDH5629568.1 flagellar biosynthesis anti-sigma factor FlgM [Gammaproteobacteria bacterium]
MVMDVRHVATGLSRSSLSKTEKSKKKSVDTDGSVAVSDQDDSISLTGSASKIGQLIEQMKAAPVVDPDRVSPVKEKLDNDSYEIDYQQVANKMLDFETDYYSW